MWSRARTLKRSCHCFPRNVIEAKKLLGLTSDNFTKYVSCSKCHSLYSVDSCKVRMPDGTLASKLCSHVNFPHHPQQQHRKPCDTSLMKTIRTSAGTTCLYPRQLFCYQSVTIQIRNLILRPGFIEKTEQWRKRKQMSGLLSDIYDGKVWSEFQCPSGTPFLSVPYNFALILNIDWFQPFQHSVYSIGAIYIAIANLPRSERYLSDNVLLVGIIPGPKEPKLNINTYLKPLVADLQELWDGLIMKDASGISVFVRAALLCISCDIPATRKVSGFVGQNAYHACSRCLKAFPTSAFGEKADFTGSDRTTWEPRIMETHRTFALKHKFAKTKAERKARARLQVFCTFRATIL